MPHEELVSGNTDVNGDTVVVPMAMVMTDRLNHDVARNEAVEEILELGSTSCYMRRERIGVIDASKGELERYLHEDARDRAGTMRATMSRERPSSWLSTPTGR